MRKTQPSRKLATVLFTDIVGSTEVAGKLDDPGWRDLVGRHHSLIRRSLKAHKGQEIDTAGDGFFATFETGADALRCAFELASDVQQLGIDVRVGLHIGEVERVGSAVRGIGVHIGARVMSIAGPAEILVTSTLRELTSGGGFTFDDAGEHVFKGIEGSWHLFRLVGVDDEMVPPPLGPDVADERLREAAASLGSGRRSSRLIGVLMVGVLATVAIVATLIVRHQPEPHRSGAPPLFEPLLVHLDSAGRRLGEVSGIVVPEEWRPRLAVGEGAVWVSSLAALYRIDPAATEAGVPTNVAGDIATGFRAVWVAGVYFSKIDPATGEPSRKKSSGIEPAVAVGAGGVWTIDDDLGIVRFDPRKDRWDGNVAVGGSPTDLTVVGGKVWYVDEFSGSLGVIDPHSMKTTALITIPGSPEMVEADPDYVWVLDRTSGIVTVVSQSTRSVVTQIAVAKPATGLAIGSDAVRITAGNELYSIDPVTFEVSSVDLGVAALGLAIDPSDNTVWVMLDATRVAPS